MPHDPLTALAALERSHDGPIPPHLLAIARAGSEGAARRRDAEAQAAFFAMLIRGQIRAIRRARDPAGLIPDLALYRRQRRRWRRIARLFA